MQDPRYKHEYLDNVHSLLTVTGENGDESDKHVDEIIIKKCDVYCMKTYPPPPHPPPPQLKKIKRKSSFYQIFPSFRFCLLPSTASTSTTLWRKKKNHRKILL